MGRSSGGGGRAGRAGQGGAVSANDIQSEIARVIDEYRNSIGGRNARRQYPITRAQEAELQRLGIRDFMPNAPYSNRPGTGDAQAVIRASGRGRTTSGFTSWGEGDVSSFTNRLNQLLRDWRR